MSAVGRDLRSFLGRALLLGNVLFAVAAALFVLFSWLAPETASSAGTAEPGVLRIDVRGSQGPGLVALFAAALLVFDVLWLIYGSAPKETHEHVVSRVDGGTVKVSREALEAGLRAAGESLDEISRLRIAVVVTAKMKQVQVRGQFQSPDGVSIQVAGQRLRETLRRRFEEMVRLADGPRLEIEVEFVGFSGKLKAQPTEDRPGEQEPEQPFTGPRYPIDGEPWKDD